MTRAIAQADIRRLAIRYDGEESGNRQAERSFRNSSAITIHLKVNKVIAHELA